MRPIGAGTTNCENGQNDQEYSPAHQRGARNIRRAEIRDCRGRRNEQVRGETPAQPRHIRPVSNTKVHHNPAALNCQVLTDGCRFGKVGRKFADFGLNIDPESLLKSEVNAFLCFFVRFSLFTRLYYCSVCAPILNSSRSNVPEVSSFLRDIL